MLPSLLLFIALCISSSRSFSISRRCIKSHHLQLSVPSDAIDAIKQEVLPLFEGGKLSMPLEPGTCDPFDPKSSEFCFPEVEEKTTFLSKRTLKLTMLFALWYFLNTAYNIGNKLVLTALPIPWTSATIELFFGLPYVGFLWLTGLRKKPKLSLENIKTLSPAAFFLAATHVGGVISFGAGAISFTHVLKATEPVWTALISAVCFREFLPLPIYATLVPIIGGVGLASMKELSFTWVSEPFSLSLKFM